MMEHDSDTIIIIYSRVYIHHLSTQIVDNLSTFPQPVDNSQNGQSYPHNLWITYPHYPHYPHYSGKDWR